MIELSIYTTIAACMTVAFVGLLVRAMKRRKAEPAADYNAVLEGALKERKAPKVQKYNLNPADNLRLERPKTACRPARAFARPAGPWRPGVLLICGEAAPPCEACSLELWPGSLPRALRGCAPLCRQSQERPVVVGPVRPQFSDAGPIFWAARGTGAGV